MGSADIYQALDSLPEIVDALVIGAELPDGGYHMPLFVVLRDGCDLDDALTDKIRTTIRTEVSPRHVPDEIVDVPAVPMTRTGKRLEVPIKKLIQGPGGERTQPGHRRRHRRSGLVHRLRRRVPPRPSDTAPVRTTVTDTVDQHVPDQLEPVDENALAALFTAARTANTFAPTPVSDQQLTDIWELTRWAPTGANTQPLRVVFVRTESGRQRLVAT